MASKTRRLLEQCRKNPAGCLDKRKLDRLLKAFGFEQKKGSKHILYVHPDYPQQRFTLPYGRKISKGYVRAVINLIDNLAQLQDTKKDA